MPNNYYTLKEKFVLRSDTILETQTIPLYDLEAVAGLTSLFIDDHIPLDKIVIPDLPKCDGAIYVRGDSMIPALSPGDIILYKVTHSRRAGLNFGEMYLLDFILDGEEYITVKYLYQSETVGHYKLVSLNPKYSPKDVPVDCVRSMALVKGSISIKSIG